MLTFSLASGQNRPIECCWRHLEPPVERALTAGGDGVYTVASQGSKMEILTNVATHTAGVAQSNQAGL